MMWDPKNVKEIKFFFSGLDPPLVDLAMGEIQTKSTQKQDKSTQGQKRGSTMKDPETKQGQNKIRRRRRT